MTTGLFQGQDKVLVTAHHEGKCVVWDFDYDCPLKVFSMDQKLTCICRFGENQVLVGTLTGGFAKVSIDADANEPITSHTNELSCKPILSIAARESGLSKDIVLINSEGIVMVV